MPCINFDSAVLDPVPFADPGHRPLRRRASAPELANLQWIHGNTLEPYEAGNTIRFQIKGRTVQAMIMKAFTPFTLGQAMVVQIFEPTLDLEGIFVLKLYDRRYINNIRGRDKVEWTVSDDQEYEKRRWSKDFVKFFQHIMAREDQWYYGDDYDSSDDDGEDAEENKAEASAYDEMFLEIDCLKGYRAELEVYRRMRAHGIDGKDVPRFIGSVRVPRVYASKSCQPESSNIKGIPGILMQYVPGFSMIDLSDTPSPPPPQEHWKSIIDDGLRIVRYWSQNMELHNKDQSIGRNSVVHWDAIEQGWKVKLIDFANCIFRKKGMRKWDWRREQAYTEEENLVLPMARCLEEKKGFEYTYIRSQYTEELIRDFRRCDNEWEALEPEGYES